MTRARHRGQKNLTNLARSMGGTSASNNLNVSKLAERKDNIGVVGRGSKPTMAEAHGGAIKAKRRAQGGGVSNENVIKAAKAPQAFDAYSSAGGPEKINSRKCGGSVAGGRK